MRAFDGPEDDELREPIRPGDPRYELLEVIRRPSASGANVLSAHARNKVTALWYWLAGEAFQVKQRGPTGRVVGLVPISPLWVLSTPTPADPWYRVQVDSITPVRQIAPADVVPFVDFDAENPYGRGVGAAASLGDELDTDEAISKTAKSLFLNRGIPEGLIVLEDAKTEAQLDLTRKRWAEKFGGPERAGQVEFAGGKASWIQLTQRGVGGEQLELRRFLRDTILQVHGVSGEVLGIMDASTRDSVDSAHYLLALGVMVPWLTMVRDAYQTHLAGDFGANVWLGFKSPIPENRSLQLNAISIAPDAFRVRDLREVGGFPPDSERGDEVLTTAPRVATPTQVPGAGAGKMLPKTNGDQAHWQW